MYSYLLMTSGNRAGAQFVLEPDRTMRLGRGLDCDIVLTDGLASRSC